MKKKIPLAEIKEQIEIVCPKCGTKNIFNKNGNYKFLYCENCKYVYAWISEDKYLTVEYNEEEKDG